MTTLAAKISFIGSSIADSSCTLLLAECSGIFLLWQKMIWQKIALSKCFFPFVYGISFLSLISWSVNFKNIFPLYKGKEARCINQFPDFCFPEWRPFFHKSCVEPKNITYTKEEKVAAKNVLKKISGNLGYAICIHALLSMYCVYYVHVIREYKDTL